MYFNNNGGAYYNQQAYHQPQNQQQYQQQNYNQYNHQQQHPNPNQYGGYNQAHQNQHYGMPPQQQIQPQPQRNLWEDPINEMQIQQFLGQYIQSNATSIPGEQLKSQYVQAKSFIQRETDIIDSMDPQMLNVDQNLIHREISLMKQLSELKKSDKDKIQQSFQVSGANQLTSGVPNLAIATLILTFSQRSNLLSPDQLRKVTMNYNYPESLLRYIQKSFEKCQSIDERIFMEQQLVRIANRCKERGILFTRDWSTVTQPCLLRESQSAYQKINLQIMEGHQGVIQRVQEMVMNQAMAQDQIHGQDPNALQNVQQSSQGPPSNSKAGTYSFSFNFNKTDQPGREDSHLFQENKVRSNIINVEDDLMQSPSKQPLITSDQVRNSLGINDVQSQAKPAVLVGTCTTLEKSFYRLTAAPNPADVRPEEILQKALKMISKKWKKKQADYRYIDEQFRSIRQDLTVQHIQNSLAVKVYETHARIALEMADLDQFNQCQTQLHYMYKKNIENQNRIEFLAYKLLYQVFIGVDMEIIKILQKITPEDKQEECVLHALKVRKVLSDGNYGRFFKLYQSAPNMGGFLMDIFIEEHRILCLQKLAQSHYNSNLELNRITRILACTNREELIKFLEAIGCILIPAGEPTHMDCKQSFHKLKQAPLRAKKCIK